MGGWHVGGGGGTEWEDRDRGDGGRQRETQSTTTKEEGKEEGTEKRRGVRNWSSVLILRGVLSVSGGMTSWDTGLQTFREGPFVDR